MEPICTCGHTRDEHGPVAEDDPHPNAVDCRVEGCDCVHYEEEA